MDVRKLYEESYEHHHQMLAEDREDVDALIEVAADLAARLELVARMLPEELVITLAAGGDAVEEESDESGNTGAEESDAPTKGKGDDDDGDSEGTS